ncbi:MAG: hypothetical protein AAGU74_12720 [Bacillota bacterium]
MAKMYLQIDSDGVIWDAIEYEHEGYTEADVKLPLPTGCIGGWYRLENGAFVFDQERYDRLNQIQERDATLMQLRDDLKSVREGLYPIWSQIPASVKSVLEKYYETTP